jgi:hypothetical protein
MTNSLVDAQGLHTFLQRLGHCYRHTGELYLVGGSSLLLVAAKTSTFDIDIKFEVPPEHQTAFIRCLRQVGRELGVPVEQASPDQFIPMPSGYAERRRFVGRFGNLDVFHFDFYAVALSKLHRGNDKDFADVISMTQQGLIKLAALEGYFQEILPRYEDLLSADPDSFQRKFALFKEKLAALPGTSPAQPA